MADLKDIVAYVLRLASRRDSVAHERVVRMVYLADWKSALERGRTVSGLHWHFDHAGPFVWDVLDVVRSETTMFSLTTDANYYGGAVTKIALRDRRILPSQLDDHERWALDFVLCTTRELRDYELIRLVYSTFPVLSSERYTPLDLVAKAIEYRTLRHGEKATATP